MDLVVVLMGGDGELSSSGKTLDKATKGALSRAVDARSFVGKKGETLTLYAPAGREKLNIVLVGVGSRERPGYFGRAQEIGAAIYKSLSSLGADFRGCFCRSAARCEDKNS